jgi:DNA mismatch endonuclease (patch repair protein)
MDVVSRKKRSAMMRGIKAQNTSPELKVRKLLHGSGFRYRLHVKKLPGKPDIVMPKYKLIVEVRGCFWHQHGCSLSSSPKTNTRYWRPKLARNVERDFRNAALLKALGWSVFIVWECESRNRKILETRMQHLRKFARRS